MTINWPRIISFLAISIALPAAVPVLHFSDSLLGAIYTVTSIVFSIGMSMVYGVDLGRLKNRDYYVSTKRMLLRVRDTSMFLFFMDSVFFIFAMFFDAPIFVRILSVGFSFSFTLSFVFLNTISLLYFVLNFKYLQNINYEIDERLNRDL